MKIGHIYFFFLLLHINKSDVYIYKEYFRVRKGQLKSQKIFQGKMKRKESLVCNTYINHFEMKDFFFSCSFSFCFVEFYPCNILGTLKGLSCCLQLPNRFTKQSCPHFIEAIVRLTNCVKATKVTTATNATQHL